MDSKTKVAVFLLALALAVGLGMVGGTVAANLWGH